MKALFPQRPLKGVWSNPLPNPQNQITEITTAYQQVISDQKAGYDLPYQVKRSTLMEAAAHVEVHPPSKT
jgi:hypothetical protein